MILSDLCQRPFFLGLGGDGGSAAVCYRIRRVTKGKGNPKRERRGYTRQSGRWLKSKARLFTSHAGDGRVVTQELYGAIIVAGFGGLNAAQPRHVKACMQGSPCRCECSRWILWQRTVGGIGEWSRQSGADVDGCGSRCECSRWIIWQRTGGGISGRSREGDADVNWCWRCESGR